MPGKARHTSSNPGSFGPDDLAEVARQSGLNLSLLTQEAIRRAINARGLEHWLDEAGALPPMELT